MIRLIRALAIALALLAPMAASAQNIVGLRIAAPATFLPATAIYCDNGGGYAALCNFGGGGQGGSTSTTSTAAAPTQVEGASNNPLSTDLSGYLRVRAKQDGAWLVAATQSGAWSITNADFGADCTVVSGDQAYTVGTMQRCTMTASGRIKVGLSSAGNIAPAAQLATTTTADLVACKYVAAGATFADGYTGSISCDAAGRILVNVTGTVTANLGTAGAGTAGTPLYTTSSTPSVGAPGSAAPANAQQVGGVGPNGNLRALATGTLGGLAPSQYTYVDSQAVSLVANATAVQIDSDEDIGTGFVTMTTAHRANRAYFVVQLTSASTSPVYLCFGGQGTACNAVHFTQVIPSGATVATMLNPPGGTSSPLFAFAPAAVALKVTSQVPQ